VDGEGRAVILYDEPADVYHRSGAIGSGDVRAYLRSPAYFMDVRRGLAPALTPALLFGTASHLRLLQPDLAERCVAVKPERMTFASNEGKAWKAEQEAAGRTIITAAEHSHLLHMQTRMPPEVAEILYRATAEVTFRCRLDDLDVQCRADIWRRKDGCVYDLKTINRIEAIESAVHKHAYHIQQVWYQAVIAKETGDLHDFRFIFVEKSPPYRWRIVTLDDEYCALAAEKVDEAIHGITARMQSGDWSDPTDIHTTVCPPAWLGGITENDEGGLDL
jgi:hypothetical protein